MNPRTKLAFFRDDEDDDLSLQSKPIDDNKAKTFGQGTLRKSKREKEKEAEAVKRVEEEREAAKAYAEFLDAFDAPTGPAATASKGRSMGFVKASDASGSPQVYEPLKKTEAAIPTGPRAREREPSPPPSSAAGPPKPKGKRAMDAFLEEIKRDQADREARLKTRTQTSGNSVSALAAFESQHGSRDRGDPLTTNIFVANLPMGITEHGLGMFFARQGPVGSVKIMWPRTDVATPATGPGVDITARRGKAAGMSGFVSFMTRKAAESCVREMDGYDWNGSVLRVGWSKAVPIAARPAYVADDEKAHRRSRSESGSRSRSRSRDRHHDRDRRPSKRARYDNRDLSRSRSRSRTRSRSRSRSPRRSTRRNHRSSSASSRSRSRSRSPRRGVDSQRGGRRRSASPSRRSSPYNRRDRRGGRSYSRSPSRSKSPEARRWPPIEEETRAFVITVADRVKDHGTKFGEVLRHRERGNPKFTFLFDKRLPEYHLFRSLLEPNYKCPYDDVPFRDEGAHSVYSTDSGEDSERERVRKGSLGRLAERRFESMLRALTGRRGEIARCMAFSLEHAEAVTEVVDIIISSLLVPSTAVPRKIARLNLICDILHNSAATIPNAWKFRQEFERRLPVVFDHLSEIYHSFPGRITAETFKKQILAVVEVWEDWIVFPPEFTGDLRTRLDGVQETAEEAAAAAAVVEQEAADEAAAENVVAASKFKSSTFKPAPAEDDMDLGDSDEGAQQGGEDDDDDDIEGEAIALDD